MRDFVILGGGTAGLSAACALSEKGFRPLVLEAGSYPMQRLCGEFLSPECLPILQRWGVQPVSISSACFHIKNKQVLYRFLCAAGSLSHETLDVQLYERAIALGAEIWTETSVKHFKKQQDRFLIELVNGQEIFSKQLIISMGKIFNPLASNRKRKYAGFKVHLKGIELDHPLEMFSYSGGYAGLSQLERGRLNLACLMKKESVDTSVSQEAFIQRFLSQHPKMSKYLKNAQYVSSWMYAEMPGFGIKPTPMTEGLYWIGDAVASIPPASGEGLSMGILAGQLLAELVSQQKGEIFQAHLKRLYRLPIVYALGLHYCLLNPYLLQGAHQLIRLFPKLPQFLFEHTRPKGLANKLSG